LHFCSLPFCSHLLFFAKMQQLFQPLKMLVPGRIHNNCSIRRTCNILLLLFAMAFDFSTKVTWLCVTIRRQRVAQFMPECQAYFLFLVRLTLLRNGWLNLFRNRWLSFIRNRWLNLIRNNQLKHLS